MLLFPPADAAAADVTGYVALTTDYVFRGVSYSDSHVAGQAGGDVSFDSGLYFGIWGSTIDLSGGSTRRDLQVNYYLGYLHELSRSWSLGTNVVAYTFPGTKGDIDYDFVEYSVVANYDDRAWLQYSWSPDLFHSGHHTHNIDLYAEWALPANLVLGAGAGYYDTSRLSGNGYGYWQLGVTRSSGRFDVDLRYHDANRYLKFISTPGGTEPRVVLSVRLTF